MNNPLQHNLFSFELSPIPPFRGTTNPRHLRALTALLSGVVDRKDLDTIAGCRNAPELVAELRRYGLEIPCYRTQVQDADGRLCRIGSYYLTDIDRMLIQDWCKRSGIKV